MISMELLSEVLGVNILEHENSPKNKIKYVYDKKSKSRFSGQEFCNRSINIYELANKCKEWAFKSRLIIITGFTTSGDWSYSILEVIDINPYAFEIKVNWGISEPEAIFKACEWILENKLNETIKKELKKMNIYICDSCGKQTDKVWEVTSSREYPLLSFNDYKTRFPQICWECKCRVIEKIAKEGLKK